MTPEFLLDLLTAGVFVAVAAIAFALGSGFVNSRQKTRDLTELGERISGRKASAWTRALAGMLPQLGAEVESIDQDLKRAGYYGQNALIDYLATRNSLTVGSLLIGGGMAVAADPATNLPEIIGGATLVIALLGYSLPRMMLSIQARRRVDRIQKGLPDALDVVRMCLTGGLPLREALDRVSREIEFFHPDIAVELEVIRRQADADTMPRALRQFARRINTPDVNALAALVTQTERTGTHVATAVTEYADSVRRAWRQRAEEQAGRTSIKLLFPVVFCLAPPIFVLLMGPPVVKLRNFVIEGHRPGGILDASSNVANARSTEASSDQP